MKKLKKLLPSAIVLLIAAISLTSFITPGVPESPIIAAVEESLEFIASESRSIWTPSHLRRTEKYRQPPKTARFTPDIVK